MSSSPSSLQTHALPCLSFSPLHVCLCAIVALLSCYCPRSLTITVVICYALSVCFSLSLRSPRVLSVAPIAAKFTHFLNLCKYRSLLRRLLAIDPRHRPNAIELLAHPYFSTPHAHMLHRDRFLIRSDDKIRQIREVCDEKSRDVPPIELTVSRAHIVNDVVEVFSAMTLDEDMLAPLHTQLLEDNGESGEDMGAVSDDMFTEFFSRILAPELG